MEDLIEVPKMGKWMLRKDKLRRRLAARDGMKCRWCLRELTLEGNRFALAFATLDHIVKKEHGGKLNVENCVLACRRCNNERHRQESLAATAAKRATGAH